MEEEKKKHIENIEKSTCELMKYQERTKDPNSKPQQLVGTVTDSMLVILVSFANSLDHGKRTVIFDQIDDWKHTMVILNRSFLVMIHVVLQMGIEYLSEKFKISSKSSEGKRYLKKLEKLDCDDSNFKKIREYFDKKDSSFEDKLNALLKHSHLDKDKKLVWQNFFMALTILRNKAAHSDVTLRKEEIEKLNKGGCKNLVKNGEIKMNPCMYKQIIGYVLDFFDEIEKALPNN